MKTTIYSVKGVDLSRIHNRTEDQVLARLDAFLERLPLAQVDALDIQDLYALTLNSLPPHYCQGETVVLEQETTDGEVDYAIQEAWQRIRANPNH